jgi:hypothetical protein
MAKIIVGGARVANSDSFILGGLRPVDGAWFELTGKH